MLALLLRRQQASQALVHSHRSFSTHSARSVSLHWEYNDRDAVADLVPAYPPGPTRWYKQSRHGLYGGQRIRFGNNVGPTFGVKTRRAWYPNVRTKKLYSEALGKDVQIRVTTRVLRTIDKVGGLDEYLLGEKSARIKELGETGWWLRWAIMQTPKVLDRLNKEREALGLPVKSLHPGIPDRVDRLRKDFRLDGSAWIDAHTNKPSRETQLIVGEIPAGKQIHFRIGRLRHLYYTPWGWQKERLHPPAAKVTIWDREVEAFAHGNEMNQKLKLVKRFLGKYEVYAKFWSSNKRRQKWKRLQKSIRGHHGMDREKILRLQKLMPKPDAQIRGSHVFARLRAHINNSLNVYQKPEMLHESRLMAWVEDAKTEFTLRFARKFGRAYYTYRLQRQQRSRWMEQRSGPVPDPELELQENIEERYSQQWNEKLTLRRQREQHQAAQAAAMEKAEQEATRKTTSLELELEEELAKDRRSSPVKWAKYQAGFDKRTVAEILKDARETERFTHG